MTISNSMIRFYVGQITLSYFVDHSAMPEDPAEFDKQIEVVRRMAEANGDLPWLLLGLQYLVNEPGVNLAAYAGGPFPLESVEAQSIMWRMLHVLQAPGGTDAPSVEVTLANLTSEEWKETKEALGTLPSATIATSETGDFV